MLYDSIREPCRRALVFGEQAAPQIQNVDESPADSFVLEIGREIDVVCGKLANSKCLRGLFGERLYEQVIGPFPRFSFQYFFA